MNKPHVPSGYHVRWHNSILFRMDRQANNDREYQGHLNSRMLQHILNHGPSQFQKLVLPNMLVLRFYHLEQQLKRANYFNHSLSAPACIENWS